MLAPTIAIVDYGLGNLDSVRRALEVVGARVVIAREPAALRAADRIVLPGVGAFGACMQSLRASGLLPALEDEVMQKGKPLLAICVGMQILATSGDEGGHQPGLGWIPGRIRSLVPRSDYRVPHMGWNEARPCRDHAVFADLGPRPTFFYVHSYVFDAASESHVIAKCDYGGDFACVVAKDNIVATQFHPEKSQEDGFTLLHGFARWTVERASRPAATVATLSPHGSPTIDRATAAKKVAT